MGNTIHYTGAPADIEQALDSATVVSDFLPSPAELVSRRVEKKGSLSQYINTVWTSLKSMPKSTIPSISQ